MCTPCWHHLGLGTGVGRHRRKGLQLAEELPGDLALRASLDFADALAFGQAPGDVGLRLGVLSHPNHDVAEPGPRRTVGRAFPAGEHMPWSESWSRCPRPASRQRRTDRVVTVEPRRFKQGELFEWRGDRTCPSGALGRDRDRRNYVAPPRCRHLPRRPRTSISWCLCPPERCEEGPSPLRQGGRLPAAAHHRDPGSRDRGAGVEWMSS